MKKFAVDFVILPPDPIMDLAIEWNRKLSESGPADIVLNKADHFPHVTLAMGCLSENNLETVKAMLLSIAGQHHALELHIPRIKTLKATSGDSTIAFDIDLTRELAALHESIVTAFKPLLTLDAVESDMLDLPPINQSSLDWINHFIPDYCFDQYWPHITVGHGETSDDFSPFSFQASRLAICHLGNHCTCREILSEVVLKGYKG